MVGTLKILFKAKSRNPFFVETIFVLLLTYCFIKNSFIKNCKFQIQTPILHSSQQEMTLQVDRDPRAMAHLHLSIQQDFPRALYQPVV